MATEAIAEMVQDQVNEKLDAAALEGGVLIGGRRGPRKPPGASFLRLLSTVNRSPAEGGAARARRKIQGVHKLEMKAHKEEATAAKHLAKAEKLHSQAAKKGGVLSGGRRAAPSAFAKYAMARRGGVYSGGVYSGGARSKKSMRESRGAATWNDFVTLYMHEHPGMSRKDAMIAASPAWHKMSR